MDGILCPECGEMDSLVPFDDSVEYPDLWDPQIVVLVCCCCCTYFVRGEDGVLQKTHQV